MDSGMFGMHANEPVRASRYQMIGSYRIVSHIATGGMGAVYKALRSDTNEVVALKLLAPEPVLAQPNLLERFRREARNGARLRHENVVSVLEFGEAAGAYFLVMEFVDGTDLAQQIRTGPLDVAPARDILVQMARALEHAHEHGIVHRDIKPANILLTEKQGRLVAKLSDFGLARNTSERETRVTRDGYTVGTIDYIAPEQAKDSSAADVRSDIYSLGCTLYHVLAGRPAFEGTLAERIHKRFESEPISVRRHNPAVPPELSAVLHRMLAPLPENRYQTPAELLHALLHERNPATAAVETELPAPPPATGPQRIAAGRCAYAMQVLAAGNVGEAVRILHECCKFDPFNIDYRRRLRRLQQTQRSDGLAAVIGWLKAWLVRRRVRTARKSCAHLKVLEFGEQVLTLAPGDVDTQITMARSAEALGQPALALWLLKHARRHGSTNLPVKRALAQFYENQRDYPAAIAAWESLQRADVGNTEAQEHIRDLSARETIARGHYENDGSGELDLR